MAMLDEWQALTLILLPVVWLLCYLHLYCNRRRSLRGLTVLITGCDSGLGRHTALHLSSLGMVVYAGCLTPKAAAALTAHSHPTLHPFVLDVSHPHSVSTAFTRLSPFLLPHGLDCLINNAGLFTGFLTEFTPISSYERAMEVNFFGAVRVTQTFLPLLRHARGRVLSVSSFLGFTSAWGLSCYAASKHAMEAWHDSLRAEMRDFGVQCSLIEPGTMRTTFLGQVIPSWMHAWERGEEGVKAAYGEELLQVAPRVEKIMQQLSSSTDGVVSTIVDSLRSEQSRSRYRVGWDCQLQWLLRFVPISDHTMDAMLAWLVAQPKPASVRKARQAS